MNNSSSETWHDRVRDINFNKTRSFSRNESECFKQLFDASKDDDSVKRFAELDKIYTGANHWVDEDQFCVMSSATHVDKIKGRVTILLHVMWNTSEDQVCIWNIATDQFFSDDTSASPSKIMALT